MGYVVTSCKYCRKEVSFMGSWDMPMDVVCSDCSKNKRYSSTPSIALEDVERMSSISLYNYSQDEDKNENC